MSDEELTPPNMPCGYFYHQPSIDRVASSVALACSAGPGIGGAWQRLLDQGVKYWNLRSFMSQCLKEGSFTHSKKRNVIDCGAEGLTLQPLSQSTGVCTGQGGESCVEVSWCARYKLVGDVEKPCQVSSTFMYLSGRDLSIVPRGDSGALPPLLAETAMKVGVLPVNKSAQWNLMELAPNGPNSEESIAIQLRDTPMLPKNLCEAANPYRTNVFHPASIDDVNDCLASGRALTTASGMQLRETQRGSSGISPLYSLGGGHQTELEGLIVYNGRIGWIKYESWYGAGPGFPASRWPDHRVVVQTDDGPKKLFPGQGVVWSDEWWRTRFENWAYDAPGIICN